MELDTGVERNVLLDAEFLKKIDLSDTDISFICHLVHKVNKEFLNENYIHNHQ